ncbi:hypothetical protein D3C77_589590 [compost metagenome]
MPVTITQDEHITLVKYAEDKRPLKIEPFIINYEQDIRILQQMFTFIIREANEPNHLCKMEVSKYYALIERLAIKACKEFSPKQNWGLTKPEIRGIVLFTLQEAIAAGEWPDEYTITESTFVREGDYNE